MCLSLTYSALLITIPVRDLSRKIEPRLVEWFYGVMVSTLDFESNNPSSSLGRTFIFFFPAIIKYIYLL